MTQSKINSLSYSLTVSCLAADLHWKLMEESDTVGNEIESDAHYADYHNSCESIIETLIALGGGKIDKKAATQMAHYKRAEIQALYAKQSV